MKNRNLRKLKKAEDAVSPIVATLMLVLVAAGGAVGLNIWLKSFNEDSTASVQSVDAAELLRIGGSSTVYEFSLAAIPAFEALMEGQGTPVKVGLEKGGSGAGRKAVGLCLVDIGSSSSPVPDSEKAKWPDCDGIAGRDFGKELKIFKVATDGVVFATLTTNTHCPTDIELTQAQAYSLYYHNMDNIGQRLDTATAPAAASDLDRTLVPVADATAASGVTAITSAAGGFTAAMNGRPVIGLGIAEGTTFTFTDANNGILSQVTTAAVSGADFYTAGNGDVTWDEIPREGTNLFCTGTEFVEIFDRKDPGGTSEIASEKLLGFSKQDQLEGFLGELNAAHQGDGNQGVLTAVKAHANKNDALFFTSFGYATAQGLKVAEFGKTVSSTMDPSSSNIKDETYDATRPILYITAGAPSPVAQLFLDFVMNPHQNQLIAEAADFESIY